LDIYLGTSRGLCRTCRESVDVQVLSDGEAVYLSRRCPRCGPSRALVAESLPWFLRAQQELPAAAPPSWTRPRDAACPDACGPCSFHAQACHLPVFSITNACDLRCPICFTYNRADELYFMSPEELARHLDFVVAATGGVDLVNITGGEPTLHPRLSELVALARRPEIGRVTVNTNGLTIARDPGVAKRLADLGVYVILSLDTLDPERCVRIHGRDITADKRRALDVLTEHGIQTTLLMVLAGGVNEQDLPPMLDLLAGRDNVRSLTIQTMAYTGQGGGSFLPRQHLPVDGVERRIESATGGRIAVADFQPLPTAHPLCYGVTYLLRHPDGELHPMSRFVDRGTIARALSTGYLLRPSDELERDLRGAVDRLWSEGADPRLLGLFRGLIGDLYPADRTLTVAERQRVAERQVKTIYIHAHMDEDTWEVGRAMRCPDQVPVITSPDGSEPRLIGACNYNLFYRHRDPRFFDCAGDSSIITGKNRERSLEGGARGGNFSSEKFPPRQPPPPESFLSATRGLCNVCGELVDAKVVARDGQVELVKWCPEHGETRGLVSSDVGWYLGSLAYIKPRDVPKKLSESSFRGCPASCGLCPSHQQHTCVPLLEITDRCDMACPICLVDGVAHPTMTTDEVRRVVDRLLELEGQVNMLTLTGGEPTTHPDLLAVVDAVRRPAVGIVSLSTNGLRLADDDALLRELVDRRVVISLQYDGCEPATWGALRGRPELAEVKRRLVERIITMGGRLSLTVTLARGVNEHELPGVLDLLFQHDEVLSVMVQPLAHGRRLGRPPAGELDRLTIPDVAALLADASGGVLRKVDFTPLPCSHPTCFALTYLLKTERGLVSLPSIIAMEDYLDVIKNQALLRTDRDTLLRIRDVLYQLWSSKGLFPERDAVLGAVRRVLLDLDELGRDASSREVIDLGARAVKSIFIHHFMDRATFDVSRAAKCCNHYPGSDGRLVPACVRNCVPESLWRRAPT
jgi:uncharacterized radical SAM superfamily Fe-S cluster-containing enzyme